MDLTNMVGGKMDNMTAKDLVEDAQAVVNNVAHENRIEDKVPGTIGNQNLGHNSKKVGMGPNTKR